MRISDWSSDVCSSDLLGARRIPQQYQAEQLQVRLGCTRALGERQHTVTIAGSRLGACQPHIALCRFQVASIKQHRSEERSVGKECVSTCRSRWSPYN